MENAESFTSIVSKQIKNINRFMKSRSEPRTNAIFFRLFDEVLPEYSGDRIKAGEWVLHTGLKFLDYQICLLANCKNPCRCLAILEKSNDCSSSAKDVLDELCYSVLKITVKENKRNKPTLSISKISPGKLCTTRRGFYAINLGVYNEKLCAIKENGVLKFRKEDQGRIADIYYKYVHGMEDKPDNRCPRVPRDIGIEQFLLEDYPSTEWRNNVLQRKEHPYSYGKRKTDESESDEDEIKQEYHPIKRLKVCEGKYCNPDNVDTETCTYTRLTDYDLDYKAKLIPRDCFEDTFDDFLFDI